MNLIDDRDSGIYDRPIVNVMKVKIDPKEAPSLLAKTLDALAAVQSENLPGFLTAQVLLSVDNKTIVVLGEWTDRHAWGKSRYDPVVESLVKDCYTKRPLSNLTYIRVAEKFPAVRRKGGTQSFPFAAGTTRVPACHQRLRSG
jgi:quinol monooxygenase YgiN